MRWKFIYIFRKILIFVDSALNINTLEANNAWHVSAKFKLQNQLRIVHSLLAAQAIVLGLAELLRQSYADKTERLQAIMLSVKEDEQVDFAILHVIVGKLEEPDLTILGDGFNHFFGGDSSFLSNYNAA